MELAGECGCKGRFCLLPNAGLRAGFGCRGAALEPLLLLSSLCLTTGLFRIYWCQILSQMPQSSEVGGGYSPPTGATPLARSAWLRFNQLQAPRVPMKLAFFPRCPDADTLKLEDSDDDVCPRDHSVPWPRVRDQQNLRGSCSSHKIATIHKSQFLASTAREENKLLQIRGGKITIRWPSSSRTVLSHPMAMPHRDPAQGGLARRLHPLRRLC
jgi:hypothetical protein